MAHRLHWFERPEKSMNHRLKFLQQEIELESRVEETIFDVSRRNNIDLGGVCGGRGFCGKCQVIVSGNVSTITYTEREFLSDGQIRNKTRLACQASAQGDISVSSIYSTNLKVATMGYEPEFSLDPAVKMKRIDGRPVIVYEEGSHFQNLKSLDEKSLYSAKIVGLAIDIGTTKIVIYALNLKDGNILTTFMEENPQIIFGADVMSRLARATSHGVVEQQRLIQNFINRAITEFGKSGISSSEIYDTVVVGNSVMHHLFLGQDIKDLSRSPYRVSLRYPKYLNSRDLHIKSAKNAQVYAPPPIEGFVGSDALMGAFVLRLWSRDGLSIFIDLGTNSEIMVASSGEILATSTPAGSAFEGMNIRHGMKSSQGAIESVAVEPDTLEPTVKTIGDKQPCGIAGSGLVDGVSEMLRAGIIDYRGKFRNHKSPNVVVGPEGPEYILSRETCGKSQISITQRDVRELQLAKAAIQAAIRILIGKSKRKMDEISRVYVAGSFGLYINPLSGINIGLFPEIEPERIETVGNTAGSGARILLKNVEARKEVEELARSIKSVDLVKEADFNKILINSTHLPSGYVDGYSETVKKLSKVLGTPKIRLIR